MNAKQLLELVVRPTLIELGLHSKAAEQLVVGTIYQESLGEYIQQLGGGPALGLIQMEPTTHDDIWGNYLIYHSALANKVTNLMSRNALHKSVLGVPAVEELLTNLKYAVAMCRIHYLRVPAPLPAADDIEALGQYWKKFYNTVHGKGHVTEFVFNYPKLD